MVSQINNGLQPTRNLKSKYLLNSKVIKRAVAHHEAGLSSIWQFLVKCSHSCAGYERRQRRWVLGTEDHDDEVYEDNFIIDNNDVLEVPQNVPEVVQNASHVWFV